MHQRVQYRRVNRVKLQKIAVAPAGPQRTIVPYSFSTTAMNCGFFPAFPQRVS